MAYRLVRSLVWQCRTDFATRHTRPGTGISFGGKHATLTSTTISCHGGTKPSNNWTACGRMQFFVNQRLRCQNVMVAATSQQAAEKLINHGEGQTGKCKCWRGALCVSLLVGPGDHLRPTANHTEGQPWTSLQHASSTMSAARS